MFLPGLKYNETCETFLLNYLYGFNMWHNYQSSNLNIKAYNIHLSSHIFPTYSHAKNESLKAHAEI